MAQIKLHGRKAYIIHNFNSLPSLIIDEFYSEKSSERPKTWSRGAWNSFRDRIFNVKKEVEVVGSILRNCKCCKSKNVKILIFVNDLGDYFALCEDCFNKKYVEKEKRLNRFND